MLHLDAMMRTMGYAKSSVVRLMDVTASWDPKPRRCDSELR